MPETTEPVIEVRGIVKTYRPLIGRAHCALAGVDLDVWSGEVLGLIGPNGAGKTTLLTCMLGLQRPDRGRIRVLGRAPDDLAVRARTGYLPERLGFDPDRTGRELLLVHAALAPIPAQRRAAAVAEAALCVGLEPDVLGRALKTYSRGMLQRIGLAQALIGEPALLFLDEPTSGMDPVGVARVRRVIVEARARGATVVLNSHQLEELERVCDRVAFVERGLVRRIERLSSTPEVRAWRVVVTSGVEVEASRILREGGWPVAVLDDRSLRVEAGPDGVEGLAPRLVAGGVGLRELTPLRIRLEDLFFTGGRDV
jgi:ABC-2 type transport system ATP-binding protein